LIKIENIIDGAEYIFFFQNYFCVGFFVKKQDQLLYLKNGHVGKDRTYHFGEAVIDIKHIIGYAST